MDQSKDVPHLRITKYKLSCGTLFFLYLHILPTKNGSCTATIFFQNHCKFSYISYIIFKFFENQSMIKTELEKIVGNHAVGVFFYLEIALKSCQGKMSQCTVNCRRGQK